MLGCEGARCRRGDERRGGELREGMGMGELGGRREEIRVRSNGKTR